MYFLIYLAKKKQVIRICISHNALIETPLTVHKCLIDVIWLYEYLFNFFSYKKFHLNYNIYKIITLAQISHLKQYLALPCVID